MIYFEEIVNQQGDRIVEETKKSYDELVERGMVFKKEPSGELRLMYDRSWWGTPRSLILPVPDTVKGKNIAMVHTHLGTSLHSLTDMLNFAYTKSLSWLGTATLDKNTVTLRAVKMNTLVPRFIPAIIAHLENKLNYNYKIPSGPRIHIREEKLYI